jgi:hypothetical protein
MISLYQKCIDQSRKVNWMLLLFLLLFLNVKTGVKIGTLVLFLFLLRKELVSNNFLKQKFIWFYFGMIIIALLNLLTGLSSVSVNYLVAAATGIGFWLMCMAAAAISFMFINNTNTGKLHSTISLFFIINALFTICQLVSFMYDAGSFNPYTYQGMNQKYFIGTGDLLKGITFDVSTTNAILNAMALLYFLDRRKFHWLLLCSAAMLLTASNFTNLLLFTVLFFQFIFQSDRNQKSAIVVCLCTLIIFFSKVSPQNKHYFKYVWQKISATKIDTILPEITTPLLSSLPDSVLTIEEKKRKLATLYLDSIYTRLYAVAPKENSFVTTTEDPAMTILPKVKPSIPKANIHTEPYQRKRDTSAYQKILIDFAVSNIPAFDTSLRNTQNQRLPGKLIAWQQTISFFKTHPFKMLTGTGIGQFSSKLAFRATGLQFAGGYPAKFAYINHDFRDNHLNLYLNYFSKDQEVHSLMNTPDSVYDQLLAEYGITGIIVFMLFYAGYFIRHYRKKSYGLPLLLLTAGAFAIGYWFEQLSIVVLFELLMLLNSKEANEQKSL